MRKSLYSLGLLLAATTAVAQETGYSTNWSGHRTLHVNTLNNSRTSTQISAHVLNYPMLVRLGAADSAIFAAAKSDGADVRFTKSNNTTRLHHSIETWDSAGRVAAVWVRLDTVYANSQAQNFRMHWGNAAAADSSNANAVFQASNGFEAVWHMGNAAGAADPRPNSVAGGNPAVPAGATTASMTPRVGLIGMADTLASSTSNPANADHFTLGNGYEFAQGQGTMSMWIKLITVGSWNNFIALSSGVTTGAGNNQGGRTNNIWMGREGSGSNFIHRTSIDADTSDGIQGNESAPLVAPGALNPTNTWAHFTVTFQDSGLTRHMYKNGVLLNSSMPLPAGEGTNDSLNALRRVLPVTRTLTFIGRSNWGDRNLRGMVDEVRISNVARSADWIALDYGTQNPTQSAVTDSVAPVIAYGVDSLNLEVGYSFTPVLPVTFTGVPQPTVAISPALPAGLTFTTGNNANRGMISGTPTAAAGTTMHVITATNGKGTFTDTIYVTVTAPADAGENYTTWPNMKTLTFTGSDAGVTSTVNMFPFLVRLTAADSAVFAGAGANGANLRFSRTNAIKLKYSIDHWDAVNRTASIWVLMDQVVTGTNTIRMHWGNGSAASLANPSAVFARNNGFVSVWHLGNADTTAPRPNSVSDGNPAVPENMIAGYAPQAGVIGMADSLPGGGNRDVGPWLNLGTGYDNWGGHLTMSLWIKPIGSTADWNQYISLSNGTNETPSRDNIWMGRQGGTTDFTTELWNGTAGGGHTHSNGAQVMDEWQLLSWTVANGNQVTHYRNGVRLATRNSNQPIKDTVRSANHIGRAPWPDPTVHGVFDEVRFSNVARSADWHALEYANQRPGTAPIALSYASLNSAPGTAITPLTPSVAGGVATHWSISGTLPAGLSFDTLTGVISGTPTSAGVANATVSVTSGIWSASAPLNISIASADGNYLTAWSGRKYVSINTTTAGVGPAAAREFNYPVLVRLGAADSAIFNASQPTGADIRFTRLDNVTRIHHQIDHWDSAGRTAAIWVKLDTVYGSSTGSRLRMHYGNPNVADSSKGTAVFDSAAGFVAVFHMGGGDNTAPRLNAVPGGNAATPANLPTSTVRTGVIGLADSLGTSGTGANGSHLSFGPLPSGTFPDGKVTLSLWIKRNSFTGWRHTISLGNGSPGDNIWFGHPGDEAGALRVRTAEGDTEQNPVNASDVWLTNTWQLIHVVFDGPATSIYNNGANVGSGDIGHVNANVARSQAYIGRALWSGDNKFLGVYDEVRVHRAARSANWAKLDFASQGPTANLVALTDNQVDIVVGIPSAASLLAGEALSFKTLNKGLLFQIQAEPASRARLAILDMQGRTVWSRNVTTGAGKTEVMWNGQTAGGAEIGSGIYVVRMSLTDASGKVTNRLNKKVPLAR